MIVTSEIEWHDGKDIPNPSTGSFLIITKEGGLAEAEYKDNKWLQYRWNVSHDSVIAWCRLSDIGSYIFYKGE